LSRLEAFWLGIVQGLTEFFPVSSSGHLVIFRTLLGTETEGGLLFEIAVHVATLVAIAIFYRRRILELVVGVFSRNRSALIYTAKLVVGTLPAVLVGLLAKDFIERQFANPSVVGVDLMITGAILLTTRRTTQSAHRLDPSWRDALLIGCAQAFAILPGISRSGSTVSVALALGLRPVAAAEFSFLLGIIAISGAAVLMIPDLGGASAAMLNGIAIGSAAALVSGVAAIWLFVRMLQKQVFHLFAYYAFVVGGGFLAWVTLRG
jgi:undecaprenyl-diphosphatase